LEQVKGDTTINNPSTATCIQKWTNILHARVEAFKREINQDQCHRILCPTAFALMVTTSNMVVQIACGFEEIVLDDDTNHDADVRIGFFLGDHVTVTLDGAIHQQDPVFIMV
jgi:hypothetical protein